MTRYHRLLLVALLCWLGSSLANAAEPFSHGRFKNVLIYTPSALPAHQAKGVVLFLSGLEGWGAGDAQLAQTLAAQGALVVGIDSRQLYQALEADPGKCVFPDGDLENLSRTIQAYEELPNYRPPLLAGRGEGAAIAYAVIAQAPIGSFGGAFTLGFCPQLTLRKPLCKGEGVHFQVSAKPPGVNLLPTAKPSAPWFAIQANQEKGGACSASAVQPFVSKVGGGQLLTLPDGSLSAVALEKPNTAVRDALSKGYQSLNARYAPPPPPPPAAVSDLPIIEIPAELGSTARADLADMMVVMISGDGGWAGIDKELAAAFAKSGLPVIGLDSLRYFWEARKPAGVAADIDRLARFYLARWKKRRLLLVGFSQGADVMPFVVNRLPAATRAHVAMAAMLSPGQRAAFEFHVTNWIQSSSDGLAIAPEAAVLPPGLGLCVYGDKDKNTICPSLDAKRVRLLQLQGGHHFDGNNPRLVSLLLQAVPQANVPPPR